MLLKSQISKFEDSSKTLKFNHFSFLIIVFFCRHWQFLGQQGKEGDHLYSFHHFHTQFNSRFCFTNLTRERGGFEPVSTITLVLQVNQLKNYTLMAVWQKNIVSIKKPLLNNSVALLVLIYKHKLSLDTQATISVDLLWHVYMTW